MTRANKLFAALAAVACCTLVPSSAARAQAELSLSEASLRWAEGDFGSPLICRIDGRPVRGLRRISIAPDPRRKRPLTHRISFTDLEIEDATRCFTELAGEVPNIVGWVQIRLPGRHRPDTGQRDFREAMRRKRGFEYEIIGGVLAIQTVAQPLEAPRRVSFVGGKATLRKMQRGSDSARLLAGFETPRKLLLELEAKDGGEKLSFPLYVPKP